MKRLLILISALTFTWSSLPVRAVTVTWDDGVTDEPEMMGDGISWNDRLNWDTDEVPNGASDVVLTTDLVRVPASTFAAASTLMTGSTDLDIDGSLTVFDSFDNSATITIDGGGSLSAGENSTLGGTGELLMQRTRELGVAPATFATTGVGSTTFDTGHTLRGEGDITANVINNGLIQAEDLDANPAAVLHIIGPMQNNNIVRSSANAQVHVSGDLTQNGSGRLIADANTIRLNQTTITGGTLETSSGGEFESIDGSLRLEGVHLVAGARLVKFNQFTGSTLLIQNATFQNDGTVQIGMDATEATILNFETSETISGSGEIVLLTENLGAVGSRIRAPEGIVGTIGVNQTVRGVGAIEAALVNDGTIIAEPQLGTILQMEDATKPKTNNNLIRADAGATLRIRNTTITQDDSNGQILANDGTVELNGGGTIVGGRLEATGTGSFIISSSGRLTDLTNNAPITIPDGNNTLFINGSLLTNNDTITIDNLVRVDGNVTVGGTGQFVLPDPGLGARLSVDEGFVFTNAAGHLISGQGQIVGDGIAINNGRLQGNSAAEPLEIRAITLGGTGVLEDVFISFAATHSPGESTAIVPLEGTYATATTATIEIEIGGTTPGAEHDQLSSTGTVNLSNGTALDVVLLDLSNGYTPAAGDRFDIVIASANDIVGTFNNNELSFPEFGLGHHLTWQPIDYSDPRKVTLEIATATPYDVDRDDDGDVDGTDFLILQREDPSQIPAWQFEYANNVGSLAASQAVPEPVGSLLMLTSISLACCYRQWHNRSFD